MMTDIHVRSFTGSGLKPYLHSMAKLRMEVFCEYPYFEEPHLDHEIQYLKTVAACKESIGVLIFDNTTLVGVSLGYPLSIEEEAIQQPFKAKSLDIGEYFFFGDSALLKQYRGRGIGHHFFDARESHIQNSNKFKKICFCVPDCPENDPQKPEDYISLHDFWRKRGFVHAPEKKCILSWKHIGDSHPKERQMSFWIKNLSQKNQ